MINGKHFAPREEFLDTGRNGLNLFAWNAKDKICGKLRNREVLKKISKHVSLRAGGYHFLSVGGLETERCLLTVNSNKCLYKIYIYHEHNNKRRISVFILSSLFMRIMFIKMERNAINVDASNVTPLRGNICCFEECIFFPKNEKPHCTFGVDVLDSFETQISEKRRFCVRLG